MKKHVWLLSPPTRRNIAILLRNELMALTENSGYHFLPITEIPPRKNAAKPVFTFILDPYTTDDNSEEVDFWKEQVNRVADPRLTIHYNQKLEATPAIEVARTMLHEMAEILTAFRNGVIL